MKQNNFTVNNGIAISDTGETLIISCRTCVHRTGFAKCAAFPSGIPMSIMSGETLHTEQVWNDQGIAYEPKFD